MPLKNDTNQWPLIIAGFVGFIFAAGLVLFLAQGKGDDINNSIMSNIKRINVTQFAQELSEEGAVVIDIRTPGEVAGGKIAGAKNIDFYSRDFEGEIDKLDRNGNYKIYCNSGNRSASALEIMRELGFENVSELGGGIQAWNFARQPTCSSC